MACFVALNVEPEEDVEEDVDDSKEIQIEEALKLYQNALKLHSQGPAFYKEADAAYDRLFESEIFSYPEAISESKRFEHYGSLAVNDEENDSVLHALRPGLSVNSTNRTPNTLPQLLYLSYKNHGQFLLDHVIHQITISGSSGDLWDSAEYGIQQRFLPTVLDSLDFFAEALERDDTDYDLWRRTSRIGSLIGSQRIARYCLEAVLRITGTRLHAYEEPVGLEEAIAGEDLRALLIELQDVLSDIALGVNSRRAKSIPMEIRKGMDVCPQLSNTSRPVNLNIVPLPPTHIVTVPAWTWTSVGKAILRHATMELQESFDPGFGARYTLLSIEGEVSSVAPVSRCKESTSTTPDNHVGPSAHIPITHSYIGQAANHDDEELSENIQPIAIHHSQVLVEPATRLDQPLIEDTSRDAVPLADHAYTTNIQIRPVIVNDDLCRPDSVCTIPPAPSSISLPTRKRTSETAGLQEPAESGRVRSKRIRARAEIAPDEENEAAELARYYEDRLQEHVQADLWLSGITNAILAKLDIEGFDIGTELQRIISGSEIPVTSNGSNSIAAFHTALRDFTDTLQNWDLSKSDLLLKRTAFDESIAPVSGNGDSSFATFLEFAKVGSSKPATRPLLSNDDGLSNFVSEINRSWALMNDLVLQFIMALLKPQSISRPKSDLSYGGSKSKYRDHLWPDSLKETVAQLLVSRDDAIYSELKKSHNELEQRILQGIALSMPYSVQEEDKDFLELVQTIFELHIDIYGGISSPKSNVDGASKSAQRDRLERWSSLANLTLNKVQTAHVPDPIDELVLRHLWSSVTYITLLGVISQEHIAACLQDLRTTLINAGSPVLELQNNAYMPEISVEAADREIAKLATMDFFSGIFDPAKQDSLFIIENLEPILLRFKTEKSVLGGSDISAPDGNTGVGAELSENAVNDGEPEKLALGSTAPSLQQMAHFLDKAGVSLRLFLWHKLRTAYDAIKYPPMVFLCSIQSLQLVVKELHSQGYSHRSSEDRAIQLVQWLGIIDNLLFKSLRLANEEGTSAFDCLDEEQFHAALKMCADLIQLMHVFVLWEDSVRVGQSAAPAQGTGAGAPYRAAMNQLREMHLNVWILQYLLFKEGVSQNRDQFPAPIEDLADYLRTLHQALGLREYCKLGKKHFLRFAKAELLQFKNSSNWEVEVAQIVYDLYGLKISLNSTGPTDHGCTADNLDRPGALELVDYVTNQAQKINVKELLKTELKGAIDRMQQVLGAPNSKTLAFNRRAITTYIKSPINPLEMYRALRGIGGLSGTSIRTEHALIAQKRWYFLLGYMTFAKFRSQKRVSPTPTDDLDIAIIFFWHDLEFDMEQWETWYRLAQVYDAKIEEETTWSSDKLNAPTSDLVVLQRSAIRCYMMAVAVAVRCADESFKTASKISDLYTEFGNRVYSSSREPFSMAVFDLRDHKRYCNNHGGTYERPPFRQLHLREAWTFASVLYRQALIEKPDLWWNWYMLGKCLWKIGGSAKSHEPQNFLQEALEAYSSAIQCAPEKRDNRHPDKDPMLEPHYKLVSAVHKMVQSRHLSPEDGCRFLDATPYAAKSSHVQDVEDWDGYILSVLKSLRNADKANWHHRMVARAAHIIYDESPTEIMAAHAAKHELTQQIFTKTMSIQVWKPEYERAGRHFVYTGRYVSFFVKLLVQLGDRSSLEALGRRVRKKPGDFIEHATLWAELCVAHLKLLRHQGGIPEGHEDTIFKLVSMESFIINSNRLETWVHSLPPVSEPDPTAKLVELLRETIELKKTNGNLMKSTLIDDLIGDIFARIYEIIVPDLVSKSSDEGNRDRMRVDHLLMNNDITPGEGPLAASYGQESDQPAMKVRPKGVGRRDIGRRAEALVAKPVLPSNISKPKAPLLGPTSAPIEEKAVSVVIENLGGNMDDELIKEVASSVPGSVHDSADDESELSDIAEEGDLEEAEKFEDVPQFPALLGRHEDAEARDTGDDGDGEENDVEDSKEGSLGESGNI